jgi:chromosome segregation ATPase
VTPYDAAARIDNLEKKVTELQQENEQLARALAAAPAPLEERKVAALEKIVGELHKIYHSLSDGGEGEDVFTVLRSIRNLQDRD